VIYLTEPIDEMTLQNIERFQDKPITDAGKEAVGDLTEEEKQSKQQQNEDSEKFRTWLRELLGDRVTRVEASARLVDSPATLVQSEYGVSPSMQKYLRAQVRTTFGLIMRCFCYPRLFPLVNAEVQGLLTVNFANPTAAADMRINSMSVDFSPLPSVLQAVVEEDSKGQFANVFNQAVLEVNLAHPIIGSLRRTYDTTPDAPEARETAEMVFNTAALAAGYALDNAADYSQMVVKLMTRIVEGV
jgi:HSP90 family molecular chaperone